MQRTWTLAWRAGILMVLLGIVEVVVMGNAAPYDLLNTGFMLATAGAVGPVVLSCSLVAYREYRHRRSKAGGEV